MIDKQKFVPKPPKHFLTKEAIKQEKEEGKAFNLQKEYLIEKMSGKEADKYLEQMTMTTKQFSELKKKSMHDG